MVNQAYHGPERRKHKRLINPPNQRPSLKVQDHEYQIINISEGGMKITIQSDTSMLDLGKAWIQGTILFSDGQAIDVEGTIIWMIDDEIGLKLKDFLPSSIIKEEKRKIDLYNEG